MGTAREEARQRLIRAATITTLPRHGRALGNAQLPGYAVNSAAAPDKYSNRDSLLTPGWKNHKSKGGKKESLTIIRIALWEIQYLKQKIRIIQ